MVDEMPASLEICKIKQNKRRRGCTGNICLTSLLSMLVVTSLTMSSISTIPILGFDNSENERNSFVFTDEFTTKSSGRSVTKWTFMAYMVGDNNIEGYLINSFENMSAVGSTADVNIVAQFDRHDGYDIRYDDWNTCKRYYITPGMTPTIANALQDLDEVNSSDPSVLSDFITWAVTNYPAEHYALIFADHGLGIEGLCEDEKKTPLGGGSPDWISLNELKQALQTANSTTGVKLDIIGFDACLMGMTEVDYQIHEFANISVHSQETEHANGWPYDTILTNLTDNPTISAEQFASDIVNCYYDYYTTVVPDTYATLSAVNLTKQTNLSNAINSFSQQLILNAYTYHTEITAARTASQTYASGYGNPYEDYTDLYDFAYEIKSRISAASVQTASQNLMDAINDAVINEKHGTDLPDSHGISIYHPEVYLEYGINYDVLVDFVPDHEWDEFLKEYYIAPGSQTMNVLLIDDDNDINFGDDQSIERFNATIRSMGYTTFENSSSATNASEWVNFRFIVWSDGDDITPLATASYRTWLTQYAHVGGHLLIEGGHIARYVPADSFMSTVLHATTDFVYSDVGDMTFKTSHPVATNPNALPATIGFTATTPGDTSGDADAVRCLSDAVGVYGWSDVRWGGSSVIPSLIEACNSIIAYDDDADVSNGGQIVYFTIDIDDIDSTDVQNQTINNSVTWITATPSENDVGVESIDTPVNGENYFSGTRDINVTVKNYGTNSQSNFNVSCEIIEVAQKGSTTVLLSEDFDEGGALPFGWDNTTYIWRDWRATNGEDAYYGTIVGGADYGFVCNSDQAGSGAVDSWLKTPVIDCTGYDTVQLNFTHRYNWYGEVDPEGIYVYVATDGSVDSADNVGYHSVGSDISLETKSVNISTYAAGQSNVQIGFRYVADFDYWWVIDDVIVNGIIPQIENTVYTNNQIVTAVLAQDDTVQVNWSYNFANATDYKIVVKTLLPGDTKWFNDEKSITITIISAFTFSLQEGWNFITLPLNTTYERAEDLANAVPNCTYLSEWNTSTSSFVSHQKGTDVNNFTINDGVGYMVYVEGDTVFEVDGIEILPVTMSLQQGWNSIGWFNETSTGAESLAQNITNCTSIAYWNNTLCRFIMHPAGTNISNFVVERGNGYLVYVTSETAWIQ